MDTHGGTATGTSTSRSRRTAVRVVTATLAAVVALTAFAAPVQAATRFVPDRGGTDDTRRQSPDSRTSDGEIRALQVRWGGGRLRVRVLQTRDTRLTDLYDLYVDTDRTDRGPERLVRFDFADGRSSAARVERFATVDGPPGSAVTCRGGLARSTGKGRLGREVLFTVPARCLGNPGTIRVSVQSRAEEFQGGADWAPAYQRFSRPIRRN